MNIHDLLHALGYTLNVTAPVFVIVFLGVLLRRTGLINENFNHTASKLVFMITLPVLIFLNILKTDLTDVFAPGLMIYALVSTLFAFGVLIWHARRLPDPADRGVFVQGGFRGNLGIIGLALVANQYGEAGIALGAILLAQLIVLYNLLSVVALSLWQDERRLQWRAVVIRILKNPLIIAVALAIPASLWQWHPPQLVMKVGHYFANMTLPLALLCIGGALDLNALRQTSSTALQAACYKLLWLPIPMVAGAVWLGYEGMTLGILMLFFGCPTAAASYVMAQAMKGNAALAANIVAMTTVGSTLTLSIGIFALRQLGLI